MWNSFKNLLPRAENEHSTVSVTVLVKDCNVYVGAWVDFNQERLIFTGFDEDFTTLTNNGAEIRLADIPNSWLWRYINESDQRSAPRTCNGVPIDS